MKQIEATGKNIEKAIESGLQELNTTMENVDIKIIDEGGFLKKAKVLITLNEEDDVAENNEVKKESENEEEKEVIEELVEEEVEHICENGVCRVVTKNRKETVVVDENGEVEDNVEETVSVEEEPTKKENKEVNLDEVLDVAEEFVKGLVYMLNLDATYERSVEEKMPTLKVKGEDLGVLIGYRGDALEAIQNLMNVIVFNKTGYKGKVILDVEGYRERRIQTLCELAERIAKQVVKNKKSFKLEPMNSYERRVIHSHLQNFEHVTTHSEGKEPDRHLIVDYVE